MRLSEIKLEQSPGKFAMLIAVAIGLPCVVVLVAVVLFAKPRHLTGNMYQKQLIIEADLPTGTSLAAVTSYADEHFDEERYDSKHRCLVASITHYSGSRSRVVEQSMLTYFYFDDRDTLMRIRHLTNFSKMPLESPEEVDERRARDPRIAELIRSINETQREMDETQKQFNKLLPEMERSFQDAIKMAPSTQDAEEFRKSLDALRSTTMPTAKTATTQP